MSLQVWFPLTKDLRQQGLLQTPAFSLSAFTQESGGKLGQYCYTDRGIIHFSEDFLANQWSLACWVKSTSWSANNDIILCKNASESTNSQFYLSIINGTSLNLGINGGSNNGAGGYSYTFSTNTWYHVAATYDGTNYAMYINGNKVKSGTCTTAKPTNLLNLGIGCRSTNVGGTASTGNANKRLNDVRIYNHCLSQTEVFELAKGLMFHYPLNRGGLGQENLIAGTDFNGTSKKYTLTSGTEGGFTYTPTETIIAATEYTVSCRLRGNANMNLYKLCTGGNESVTWVNRSQLSTTEYRSFSITFTYPTNKTLNQIYICTRYGTANSQTGDWFEIEPYSLKLEKGSIATAWCPNSSDTFATAIGLNNNIEYDCSGYCNNGTRTGTFSWVNDTPRYSVSTAFEKGIITSTNSFVVTADPIFSVSLWFKLKSGITYTAYTDLISFSSSSYSNQPFRLELCGTPVGKSIMWFRGPSGQSGGFAVKSDVSTDVWYHTVLVSEGNKQYSYYVNGEKLGTYNGSANSWTPTGNISLGENINGVFYESDVRVYATALSAEDVLELYHTAARIDNLGNTYIYQYIET